MGFFFNFGNKPTSSAAQSAQTPAPTAPAAQAPAATKPPVTVQVHSEPAKPVAPPPPAKVPEIHRFVLTMSSTEEAKLKKFFAELLVKIANVWHSVPGSETRIKGRIGMHSDGKKVRIELKAYPDDTKSLLAWVKVNHVGTYASSIFEGDKMGSWPHTGAFQIKTTSW